MSAGIDTTGVATEPSGAGGAVGMATRHWYVAIVNHNTEKASAEKLTNLGYDCYVAAQKEYRQWRNGRRAQIDRIVIPSTLFVRCTEKERLTIVTLPYIYRFLTNKAAAPDRYGKPVAIIPDRQIENLRFMLGNTDRPVNFIERQYCVGDKVRVTRGSLMGLTGIVQHTGDGGTRLIILLDFLGGASMPIDPINLEPVK